VIFAGDDLGDFRPFGPYANWRRREWQDYSSALPRPRRML
jgi:hypothetical protein